MGEHCVGILVANIAVGAIRINSMAMIINDLSIFQNIVVLSAKIYYPKKIIRLILNKAKVLIKADTGNLCPLQPPKSPKHVKGLYLLDCPRKTVPYFEKVRLGLLRIFFAYVLGVDAELITVNVFADEFESYCEEVLLPSTWGGQIELLALSRILQLPIHVIQADVDTTVHGEESGCDPIILT